MKWHTVRLLFTLSVGVFSLNGATSQDDRPQSLVVTDVTVIPVSTLADRLEHVTVVIQGDRIAAIAPSSEAEIPPLARRIDGRGKFLIPGLVDLHVHLSKTRASAMKLLVANGVTTVRDMGGDFEELSRWRLDIESGSTIGPRMVMAGPYLESAQNLARMRRDPPEARVEPFERTRIAVGSPAEARRLVASVAALRVDFIKIRTVANEETFLALNAAANDHGIPLVGHVTGLPPQRVLRAGQDGIDHWFYPSIDGDTERVGVWKEFARRGVPIVPTISVLPDSTFIAADRLRAIAADDAGIIEPRRQLISRFLALDWREQASEATAARSNALESIWKTIIRRDLREMHEAGMDVLVGTDTAVLNLYPGFAIHDEMSRFVSELGMTPTQVLERATRRSAQFLRLGDSIGTVERGKRADLVLLDGDPTLDIANTRRIAGVFLRGRFFDRQALTALENEVRSAPDVRADDWGRTRK